MKKLIQILAVLSFLTQLFAFTPHINKGRIEEISVARACAEMKIPESDRKNYWKQTIGISYETIA